MISSELKGKSLAALLIAKLLLCPFLLAIPATNFAQDLTDTIYYDRDWSVCEQPVAEYYRTTIVNKKNAIFFKGVVIDFFIDGTRQMTGQHDNEGKKQGLFTFYGRNGKIEKQGNFQDDDMKGIWSFYNTNGDLTTQIDCINAENFTPILIINTAKDTILKDGTGKFMLDFASLAGIRTKDYIIIGEVLNRKKNGTLDYYRPPYQIAPLDKRRIFVSEVYRDGLFVKGFDNDVTTRKPFYLTNLSDVKLTRVDNFYHSNIVFGSGPKNDGKLIDFIVNNTMPEINAASTSYDKNIGALYRIIGEVVREEKELPQVTNVSFGQLPEKNTIRLLAFDVPANFAQNCKDIQAQMTIILDTMGYVNSTTFKGNLGKDKIKQINYYLSRLSGLYVEQTDGAKGLTFLDLQLFTIINELDGGKKVNYEYYCTDAPNVDSVIEHMAVSSYFIKNLRIPESAIEKAPKKNYIIRVSFIVNDDGSTTDIKADINPGFGLAEEAMRVIKEMPKTVANKYHKSADNKHTQAITFNLQALK